MDILLDMDGVIVDFVGGCSRIASSLGIEKEFLSGLEKGEFLLEELFPGEAFNSFKREVEKPGFWLALAPMPGAVETIKSLHDHNHELIIVTAPYNHSPRCYYEKVMWVNEYLPFINTRESFIGTSAKYRVRGDLLVDDQGKNIDKFFGLTCKFNHPYNRTVESDFSISSWKDFPSVINSILGSWS